MNILNKIFALIVITNFQIVVSQTKNEITNSNISTNWENNWIKFSGTVEKIDNDSESLEAYSEARKLINRSKKITNLAEKMFLVNKAKTLIFYGMSYSKAVNLDSKNIQNNIRKSYLKEIISKIYPTDRKYNTKNLIESELYVNESMVNFYLVSDMKSYDEINVLCLKKRKEVNLENLDLRMYWLNALFSIKKTNFKISVKFLADLFYIKNNNPTENEIAIKYKKVLDIGKYLDSINNDMKLENELIRLIQNDNIIVSYLIKSIDEL
jgi:hypothetical protein